MKKLFTKWKWLEYVEAALLIILGIVVICFYANPNLHAAVGYIVGAYLLLNAILLITSALMFNLSLFDGDLISGIFLLTISIWLFVEPTVLISALPLIIGVVLIGFGLILVIKAILLFATIGTKSKSVVSLILGVLFFALGITLISLQYSGSADVASVILLVLGIILLLSGISLLTDMIFISHHAKKLSKKIKENIVDVEIEQK